MAFTASDLTNIDAAIVEIAAGKRVVATEVNGQRREFQRVDLDKLIALRAIVQADVAGSAGNGIFRRVAFVDER